MSAENNLENMFPLRKPKFWLSNEEKDSRAIKDAYAFYGHIVAREIRRGEKDFPQDVIIVGDNWTQVVEDTSRPKVRFIGWAIEDRYLLNNPIDQIDAILEKNVGGIYGHIFTPRMLKKVAILDVSRWGYPLYSEQDVKSKQTIVIEKRNWGRVIKRLGFTPLIYHVTHNYEHLNAEKALWYKDDFIDEEKPSPWLNSFDGIELEDKIGKFALRTVNQIRQEVKEIPLLTLVVGDNWQQLVLGRTDPKNSYESEILEKHKTALFGEVWPPEPRGEDENFFRLFVNTCKNLSKRGTGKCNLSEITIIDRTTIASLKPIINRHEYIVQSEEEWGKILLIPKYKMVVYYINQDVLSSPEKEEELAADHFN